MGFPLTILGKMVCNQAHKMIGGTRFTALWIHTDVLQTGHDSVIMPQRGYRIAAGD